MAVIRVRNISNGFVHYDLGLYGYVSLNPGQEVKIRDFDETKIAQIRTAFTPLGLSINLVENEVKPVEVVKEPEVVEVVEEPKGLELPDMLKSMSKSQLVKYAEDNNLDIDPTLNKEKFLSAILEKA